MFSGFLSSNSNDFRLFVAHKIALATSLTRERSCPSWTNLSCKSVDHFLMLSVFVNERDGMVPANGLRMQMLLNDMDNDDVSAVLGRFPSNWLDESANIWVGLCGFNKLNWNSDEEEIIS